MDNEIVYFEECNCLFCDDIRSADCQKRYFDVIDFERNRRIRAAFCHEFVRGLAHKIKIGDYKNRSQSLYHTYNWPFILKNELANHVQKGLGYKDDHIEHSNNFTEAGFNVVISEKLNIYRTLSFKSAIELSLSGCYLINDDLRHNLNFFFQRISKYKKKKQEVELFYRLTKNMNWGSQEQRTLILSQILNIIFNQSITNKQYETSE